MSTKVDSHKNSPSDHSEEGAMTRRLSEISDESITTGGKGAVRAVQEAGFSEELKERLLQKISDSSFKNEHASAFAEASLPASAPKHAKELAAAKPWTGTESMGDAALRMLNDSHKRVPMPVGSASIRGPPSRIDTGRPRNKVATGARIANARDKTSIYSFAKDASLSAEEREKLRQEMKARFAPAARAVPATIQGLASLANERIEDAIARGQFKNLPRGKKIERDHNASSPFIDTTEYLMNKIIQKQDIVPPWIEKQQELVSTAARFRGRLRADWRRHVARVISSRGGSLEGQIKTAKEYALAELIANPPKQTKESVSTVTADGNMSHVTVTSEPEENLKHVTQIVVTDVEQDIRILEQSFDDHGGRLKQLDQQILENAETPLPPPAVLPRRATGAPFRDTQWETTERAYHQAAIENLNAITRSYNLMAPSLARKPYFTLDRELKACFAEVAPQIPAAIRERALAPKVKGIEVVGHKPGGVMDRLGAGDKATVFDERRPQYGFKEFWRDLFSREAA